MTRILFVCLGNICRSPTAEAVMQKLITERGLTSSFVCDSAGTSGYHIGDPADSRMISHGRKRGYDLTSLSRQFIAPEDFENFDYILVMDQSNYDNVAMLDPTNEYTNKLFLMTQFCTQHTTDEVPDPYYGGAAGFEQVIDLLEDACEGLLEHILKQPSQG